MVTSAVEFDPVKLRARFHDLTRQRDSIVAVSEPLRTKRDKFVNDARAKEEIMNADIREAEAGLADLEAERAMLVRALGGQTGEA